MADGPSWNLEFHISRSLRYHAYRRSFWNSMAAFTKALTIVTGTAVFVSVVGERTIWAEWMAAIVALASAADLVLGFDAKARIHDGIYRRFSETLQDVVRRGAETPTPRQLAEWHAEILRVEMDEPNTMDWLEKRCAAEESIAHGRPPRALWIQSGWKIWFSQLQFWPSKPPLYLLGDPSEDEAEIDSATETAN